jgi:Cu+-exporting ATPase
MAGAGSNNIHPGHEHHGHGGQEACDPADIAIDPVCGMTVNTTASKHQVSHGGRTFHFCAARCREKFIADPAASHNRA